MKPGPKPTPTKLKILRGNPGNRRLNRHEPKPTPKAPTCPTTLSQEAKAEWRRVAPELERLGLLTLVDRGTLSAYCIAWATLIDAHKQIRSHGAVLVAADRETVDPVTGEVIKIVCVPVKNPWLQIQKESAAIVRAFAVEFGLTPSSRAGIELPEPDDDELSSLLAPRQSSTFKPPG